MPWGTHYEGPKPDNPNFRFFDTRKWDFTSRLIPFFRIPDFLLAEIQILLSLLNPVVQKWTTQIYKFLLVEDRKFQNLGFRALQNFRISTSRNSEFQVLALTWICDFLFVELGKFGIFGLSQNQIFRISDFLRAEIRKFWLVDQNRTNRFPACQKCALTPTTKSGMERSMVRLWN